MLQSTSSALAANAIRNEDKEIVWFRMSEDKLKEEIQKIKVLFEDKRNRMTGKWIVPTSSTWQVQSWNGTTTWYTSSSGQTYNLNDYK
jgi:hypothetical protein